MSIELTVLPLDFDSPVAPKRLTSKKREITLGRDPQNDVVLDRPEVSGTHAKLRIVTDDLGSGAKLCITDLGSSNGTLVENTPLASQIEMEMEPNQRIIIGNYLIKPVLHDEPEENYSDNDPEHISEKIVVRRSGEQQKSVEDTLTGFSPDLDAISDKPDSNETPTIFAKSPFADLIAAELEAEKARADKADITDTIAVSRETKVNLEEEAVEEVRLETKEEKREVMERTAVTAPKESLVPGPIEISGVIDGDDVTGQDFVAAKLCSISGRIIHKGEPLVDVEVDGGKLGKVRTNGEGYYVFREVPEGTTYQLRVSHPGFTFAPRNEDSGRLTH